MRKAEKLFMQGLSEAGGTIDSKGKIHIANKEDDEGEIKRLANPKSVDNDTSEGYNDSEYMNRRGWADGVLSVEDRALLTGKISEAQKKDLNRTLNCPTVVICLRSITKSFLCQAILKALFTMVLLISMQIMRVKQFHLRRLF